VAHWVVKGTSGMQGRFPRSDPCEKGDRSRTGYDTCRLLSAPVGTLCRLLWRGCTPFFAQARGDFFPNPPACVTRDTRVIGTMHRAAAVTPVLIIRVSFPKVLSTQMLQQKRHGCRMIPISQASCRNSFQKKEICYIVKMYRLFKCHVLNSFLSIR
jgi:hypothetical protein